MMNDDKIPQRTTTLSLQQELLAHLGKDDAPSPRVTQQGVLLYDGSFYPCACHRSTTTRPTFAGIPRPVQWVDLFFWDGQVIPCAIGSQPRSGQVCFATEAEAEQYAWREAETFDLLWDAQQLAALSELSPERNSWYCEEITAMLAACEGKTAVPLSRIRLDWSSRWCEASVWVWPASTSPVSPTCPIKGVGGSVDEAIEQLYERCYQQLVAPCSDDAATISQEGHTCPS